MHRHPQKYSGYKLAPNKKGYKYKSYEGKTPIEGTNLRYIELGGKSYKYGGITGDPDNRSYTRNASNIDRKMGLNDFPYLNVPSGFQTNELQNPNLMYRPATMETPTHELQHQSSNPRQLSDLQLLRQQRLKRNQAQFNKKNWNPQNRTWDRIFVEEENPQEY